MVLIRSDPDIQKSERGAPPDCCARLQGRRVRNRMCKDRRGAFMIHIQPLVRWPQASAAAAILLLVVGMNEMHYIEEKR